MATITKADIIDRIAHGTGMTKVETEAIVDGFVKSVIEALSEGHRIEMRGFGVFSVRKRQPRMARNPRTGEQVPLDEQYVPIFKPSREMRSIVDANRKENALRNGTNTLSSPEGE